MDLRNTVGILTGASRGIGVHVAEQLAAKGVSLALAARSAEELEAVAERLRSYGVRAIAVPTDVADRSQLERLVERATQELGPVDLLVNNAGIERYARFEGYDIELLEKIFAVNVVSATILSRLVLPGMIERRRGHIANMASLAGKTAVAYNAIYCSTKHALVGFSWALRAEMAKHNVGVSAICPGFVSDAGMFSDWSKGSRPPRASSTVTPQKVARATVEAIEKNKAEVLVTKGGGKIVDVVYALSPDLGIEALRRTGVYGYLEKKALHSDFRT